MTIDKSLDPDRKQLLDTIVDNHRFVFGELHRVVLNLWALMTKVEERNWARNTISDECKGADVVALEALRREVIQGLCRLDEDGATDWSFHSIKAQLAKSGFPDKFVKRFNTDLAAYRKLINNFKTEHRNAYISHPARKKITNQFHLPVTEVDPELTQCVAAAIHLGDFLFCEYVEYTQQRLSSPEKTIDIRASIYPIPEKSSA